MINCGTNFINGYLDGQSLYYERKYQRLEITIQNGLARGGRARISHNHDELTINATWPDGHHYSQSRPINDIRSLDVETLSSDFINRVASRYVKRTVETDDKSSQIVDWYNRIRPDTKWSSGEWFAAKIRAARRVPCVIDDTIISKFDSYTLVPGRYFHV